MIQERFSHSRSSDPDLLTSKLLCQLLLTWISSPLSLNVVWFFVFTARHVCRARLSPDDVCPSVCHTPVFCQHRWICRWIYPQNFFTIRQTTILLFPYQTGW